MRLNWDDIQIVLSVARQGSTTAAADKLGVSHSTIIRRITAFEKQQNTKLFERHSTGYRLTGTGEELVRIAQSIETSMFDIERQIFASDRELSGEIHVTTTDTFLGSGLVDCIADFRKTHPNILLTLNVTNVRLDLDRNNAEVAIRPSQKPPDHLIGRNVAAMDFAIYGAIHAHHKGKFGKVADLEKHNWLGVETELLNAPVSSWLTKNIPPDNIIFKANSFTTLNTAIAGNIGIGAIPCCLGETNPHLVRLTEPIADLQTNIWVLTHPDLRQTARIRALNTHLMEWFKVHKSRFQLL